MLIECRQRRKAVPHIDPEPGTKVKLFGRTYHFRPQPELLKGREDIDPDAHVCEVKEERAAKRLLSIPEGYNEVGKPPLVPPPARSRVAPGQPEVHTELLDDDDELGAKDPGQEPVDPMAEARRLQEEWINQVLEQPATAVQEKLSGLSVEEIDLLLEGEQAGKQRKNVMTALEAARESAQPQDPPKQE